MVFAYFRQFPHCSPRLLDFNHGAAVAELWVGQKDADDHLRFSFSLILMNNSVRNFLIFACERYTPERYSRTERHAPWNRGLDAGACHFASLSRGIVIPTVAF